MSVRSIVQLGLIAMAVSSSASASEQVTVDERGTVHVPAAAVPLSSYLSEEAKKAFIELGTHPLPLERDKGITRYRETMDRYFYTPRLDRAKAIYPVTIEARTIAGVHTDVVTPKDGVAPDNRDRVLINLHGGGFRIGAGLGGLLESVPIAGSGKIKVITVDYRQGPENKFPAASEDVAAVYKELLKQYQPRNIGIYGCSAGGVLTAQALAWFQKEHLPAPGAIGIFCAGADANFGGDSRFIAAALDPFFQAAPPPPEPNPPALQMSYLGDADLKDPLVSPVVARSVLARFPPTLIITGTRAMELGSATNTQRQLVNAGVSVDLHVWEGMWHGFINDVTLPESIEAFAVTTKFFAAHLGKPAS